MRYLRLFLIVWLVPLLFVSAVQDVLAADKNTATIILPEGTLNVDQLADLLIGNTVESVTAVNGRKSFSYYAADGSLRQSRNGQTRYGKWHIRNDGRICLQMEQLPEKCRIIVKDDGIYKKYIVKKNGKHQHSVSYPNFWSGNSRGL